MESSRSSCKRVHFGYCSFISTEGEQVLVNLQDEVATTAQDTTSECNVPDAIEEETGTEVSEQAVMDGNLVGQEEHKKQEEKQQLDQTTQVLESKAEASVLESNLE